MVLFTRATNLHSAVTLSEPHRRLMAAVNGVFSPVMLSGPLSVIRFQNKVKVVKKVEQNNIFRFEKSATGLLKNALLVCFE